MKWKDRTFREAKLDIHDEFYTRLVDIEAELKHYDFSGKTVYCNCDDPDKSMFVKYFSDNFVTLGLKKLIATSYSGYEESEYEDLFKLDHGGPETRGKFYEQTPLKTISEPLSSNGDFRSSVCIELLNTADVIVTNPPFSLFTDLVELLTKYKKDFLLLGNNNSLICKEIFPQIQNGRIHLGTKSNQIMTFDLPDGSEGKVHGLSWFTTLSHNVKHKPLNLTCEYNEMDYPTYVNYNAIEVDRIKLIPKDYFGEIGVPITYLGKYCPEQFEITGLGRGQSNPKIGPLGKAFVDNYNSKDSKRCVSPDCTGNLGYWDKNGNAVIPYIRLLIKRRLYD